MKKFREEKKIIILDKMWVNVGHTTLKEWRDKTIKTPREAFLFGLLTGLKPLTARGQGLYCCTTVVRMDLSRTPSYCFSPKITVDYHSEMDGDLFETWFKDQLLPNIPSGSVLAMDNASYHSRRGEKVLTVKNRKIEININSGYRFKKYKC